MHSQHLDMRFSMSKGPEMFSLKSDMAKKREKDKNKMATGEALSLDVRRHLA